MTDATTSNHLYRGKDMDKVNKLHPLLKSVVLQCAANGAKFIVIETTRDRASQQKAFAAGNSRARWGQSAHDYSPALAVDLGPFNYPGAINDYHTLALAMFAAAKEVGVNITWGGDWKSIKDYPHFELANWKVIAKREKLNT